MLRRRSGPGLAKALVLIALLVLVGFVVSHAWHERVVANVASAELRHAVNMAEGGLYAGLVALIAFLLAGRREDALRREQEALMAERAHESRYRLFFNQSPDGIVVVDLGTRKAVDFNDAAARQLGYAREEFAALEIGDYEALESAEQTQARIERLRRHGRDEFVTKHKTRSGELRDVQVTISTLQHEGRLLAHCLYRDVTELRRAQETLAESERRFRTILEGADFLAVALDIEGRVWFCNDFLLRLTDRRREEVLGKDWFSLFLPAETAERVGRMYRTGIPSGTIPLHFENPILARDGEERLIRWSNTVLHHPDGSILGAVSLGEDVTEVQRAQRALVESEGRLAMMVETAMDAIVSLDEDGHVVVFNAAAERMFQVSAAEAIGGPIDRFIPGRFRDAHPGHVAELVSRPGGRAFSRSVVGSRADGSEFPIELSASQAMVGGRRLSTAILRDVSEQHRLEAARRKDEERLRLSLSINDRAPELSESQVLHEFVEMAVAVTDSRIGYVHLVDPVRRSISLAAWSREAPEQCAEPSERHYPLDTAGVWADAIRLGRPVVHNDHQSLETRLGYPESHCPVRRHMSVPVMEGGGASLIVGVGNKAEAYDDRDVRRLQDLAHDLQRTVMRKRAEEGQKRLRDALAQASAEWRRTFDAMQSAVVVVDAEQRVLRVNRATATLARREPQDLPGVRLTELGSEEPWTSMRRLAASEGPEAQQTLRVTDAADRHWDVSATRAAAGDGSHTILIGREVTRLARLEAATRQAERFAAIGAVAAGVAHEVRNPLFAISANVDALGEELRDRPDVAELLQAVHGEVGRLGRLMEDLLAYGKPSAIVTAEGPFEAAVDAGMHSCTPIASAAGVTLRREGAAPRHPVRMDKDRIAEVVEKLIENAIQHSARGATVSVRMEGFEQGGDDWVRCSVRDEGPGFREEDLPHVFEPFFTRRHGGTGLGLPIAQRIVERHGGRLSAANGPARGAVLTLELPARAPIEPGGGPGGECGTGRAPSEGERS
jgi:PAS domain S-box-containing protein